MVVSKGQPMRPAEVALLDVSDKFSNPPSYEKSGEVIQTDNAVDIPLLSLTVHGKSVQDGTPTPDAPVPVQTVRTFNLWDEQWENGIIYAATGLPSTTGYEQFVRAKNYIPAFPETEYYFRMSGDADIWVFFYDKDKNPIAYTGSGEISGYSVASKNSIRTTPAGTVYIRFYLTSEYGRTYNNNICINLNNPVNNGTYVPYGHIGIYNGETVTLIDLQGLELASLPSGTNDILNVYRNGRVKLVKQVQRLTMTGAHPYWINAYDGKGIATQALAASGASYNTTNNLYSDRYLAAVSGAYITSNGNYIVLTPPNENVNSKELFNEWLASHNTTIVYPLATPITYTLPSIIPPTPVDGGIIRVIANVTPEIDASYVATGMQGGILLLNTCADDLASLDERVTRLENELDNF